MSCGVDVRNHLLTRYISAVEGSNIQEVLALVWSWSEFGLLIEVAIFFPTNVAFLSSLWTKLVEIWYTFNLT